MAVMGCNGVRKKELHVYVSIVNIHNFYICTCMMSTFCNVLHMYVISSYFWYKYPKNWFSNFIFLYLIWIQHKHMNHEHSIYRLNRKMVIIICLTGQEHITATLQEFTTHYRDIFSIRKLLYTTHYRDIWTAAFKVYTCTVFLNN